MMPHLLYLSSADVKTCEATHWDKAGEEIKKALLAHDEGKTVQPSKINLAPQCQKENETHYVGMPSFIGGSVQMAGMKWVNVRGIKDNMPVPTVTALLILNDQKRGIPAAILEATWLTAMRTAVCTAIAAYYLANRHSKVLTIIGAGVQGEMHIHAMKHYFLEIEEIRIYNRTAEKAQHLASKIQRKYSIPVRVCENPETAVRDGDIIVSATNSKDPIIEKEWLKQGVFYAQVGMNECTFDAVRYFNRVYVDDWEQIIQRGVQTLAIMKKAGEFSENDIAGSLGQIINKKIMGRTHQDERIMFSNIGLGILDVAIGWRIYNEALQRGIGHKLPLWEEGEEL